LLAAQRQPVTAIEPRRIMARTHAIAVIFMVVFVAVAYAGDEGEFAGADVVVLPIDGCAQCVRSHYGPTRTGV
jgi:hypothetical protein